MMMMMNDYANVCQIAVQRNHHCWKCCSSFEAVKGTQDQIIHKIDIAWKGTLLHGSKRLICGFHVLEEFRVLYISAHIDCFCEQVAKTNRLTAILDALTDYALNDTMRLKLVRLHPRCGADYRCRRFTCQTGLAPSVNSLRVYYGCFCLRLQICGESP